ncbi:MAG: DUF434 domain-containing protein [Sandaracinus sp.]
MDDEHRRRHRGPAPKDHELFAEGALPALRTATSELAWLLERGYASPSALKLVGDRHDLTARQRAAVERAAVPEPLARSRRDKHLALEALEGRTLAIDGFNVLIVGESALSGAPLFVGRDGAIRDLGGVHGSWHRVAETERVIEALASILAATGCAAIRVVLDAPVSNSGRLRALFEETFARIAPGLAAEISLAPNADHALRAMDDAIVASADGIVIDHARRWVELVRPIAAHTSATPWWIELG